MSVSQIAHRYAKALFEAAVEGKNQPATIAKHLRGFYDTLESSSELRQVLGDSALTIDERKAVLSALFSKARTLVIVRNMLFVILERGRLPMLGPILDEFDRLLTGHEERIDATVLSATELSGPDTQRLTAALERLTSSKVSLTATVDPSLLGGVIVRFGNTVLDGSLQSQLADLGDRLQAT